jgi:hypothetical protein
MSLFNNDVDNNIKYIICKVNDNNEIHKPIIHHYIWIQNKIEKELNDNKFVEDFDCWYDDVDFDFVFCVTVNNSIDVKSKIHKLIHNDLKTLPVSIKISEEQIEDQINENKDMICFDLLMNMIVM